jgi:TRAP-type C4-dicarboxylate transport system permease small subunit
VLLFILVIFSNVVLRYVFNTSFVFLAELEWHLFAFVFLVGFPVTFTMMGTSFLFGLRGIIPFVILQLIVLVIIAIGPAGDPATLIYRHQEEPWRCLHRQVQSC